MQTRGARCLSRRHQPPSTGVPCRKHSDDSTALAGQARSKLLENIDLDADYENKPGPPPADRDPTQPPEMGFTMQASSVPPTSRA